MDLLKRTLRFHSRQGHPWLSQESIKDVEKIVPNEAQQAEGHGVVLPFCWGIAEARVTPPPPTIFRGSQ